MNKHQLRTRPWTLPAVQQYFEYALRERVLRWLSSSKDEALVHKYRGRHWAKCARWEARSLVSKELRSYGFTKPTGPELKVEALVQKELCRRYALVDSVRAKEEKYEVSQQVMNQYSYDIRVTLTDGEIIAYDHSRKTLPMHFRFPRTHPLTSVEAKAIKSYFCRIRSTPPLAPKEPARKALLAGIRVMNTKEIDERVAEGLVKKMDSNKMEYRCPQCGGSCKLECSVMA